MEIRSGIVLPARRENIELHTEDGLTLVGELALPLEAEPVATLVCLHPNPTQGGNMDSHVMRKCANRLPALANVAVLRFNTRGTSSPRGTSEGEYGATVTERADVLAAAAFVRERGLPNPWFLGWSFGTELTLKHGVLVPEFVGAILLSPPLQRVNADELDAWNSDGRPVIALVPEHDTFLPPEPARAGFARITHAEVRVFDDAKHLWVGESQVARVIAEIVSIVNPAALPLPTEWHGPLGE